MRIFITLVTLAIFAVEGFAQIDKTGYSLVYSSETPEAASAELSLTDEELANCTGDFLSPENFERNWNYCPRQTSKWNKRMATNDEDRAKVHLCEDGKLRLLALSLDGTKDNCITSGIKMKQGYKYGIIEVKAKCNPHKSNFPAVWMMPSHPTVGWPSCGEIDIMEQIGTSSTVYSTVHLGARYDEPVGRNYSWSGSRWFNTDYHIYSLLWTKTCLTFYCDGIQVFKYAKDATLDLKSHPEYEHAQFPYNEEFYVILDQALGCNASWGDEDPDPEFTYEMTVDYVRIFQGEGPEEKLNYYTISNASAPSYFMTVTDNGLAGTETMDMSNPDPNSVFAFVPTDAGGKYFLRTLSGKTVGSQANTNKQIPCDGDGTPYYIIEDEEKGVAFDYATATAPTSYADGSRALILNTSRDNIISTSGSTKASAWWILEDVTDIVDAIKDVHTNSDCKRRKIMRDGMIIITDGEKEYTISGIRIN